MMTESLALAVLSDCFFPAFCSLGTVGHKELGMNGASIGCLDPGCQTMGRIDRGGAQKPEYT